MSTMNDSLSKSITFMFQTHKLKFHPFKSTTHILHQALNHCRRREQAKIWYVLKKSCPEDFKTPLTNSEHSITDIL